MKTCIAITVFLISIISSSDCFGQTSTEIISQFDTTSFKLSYSKKDIPGAFKRHFKLAYRKRFVIANPDEDFYKFHYDNRKLPKIRLIFANKEIENSLGFVYYEVVAGGIELRHYLFISVYSRKKITSEIILQIPKDVSDYLNLKRSIKEKHFKIYADNEKLIDR